MLAIEIIQNSIRTHKNWAEYFEKCPEKESLPEYHKLGGAKFHRKYIQDYEKAITQIQQLSSEFLTKAEQIKALTAEVEKLTSNYESSERSLKTRLRQLESAQTKIRTFKKVLAEIKVRLKMLPQNSVVVDMLKFIEKAPKGGK